MRALSLTLITCLFVLPVYAKYSSGTGEPNDPYQIATAEDLMLLGETPEDYDKHFILTADIDLDPNLPGRKVFDRAVIASDTNDATWRFEGTFFIGVFDGSGHTISHLKIIGGWSLGVFGRLESAAQIRDLGVVDVSVAGSGGDVGGLAGYSEGDLSGCYSAGVVSGSTRVGGLIGENEGRLSRCYSTCEVAGRSDVGGLIGSSEGEVTNCYSTGTVSGEHWVGGLLGRNDQGNVTYCYSIGPVSGIGAVGGLVGTNEGSFGTFSFSSSFWDIQTSGQAKSAGGTGKTTDEMHDIRTYQNAGWDLVGEIANGTHETWQIPKEGGYPLLTPLSGYTPCELQGVGTVEDPYLISDALELGAMVHYSRYAHYRLAAPIDLSGIRWSTSVIPQFAGTLDGDGHTISHLTINGQGYLGLFGRLEPGAEVFDLGVVDVNITGDYYCAGGLVGDNAGGAIAASYTTGVVGGAGWAVGGLVGYNNGVESGLMVTHCYSTAAVNGTGAYAGGLVGFNCGRIARSYSTGAVRGGGLVGSGSVERVTACFWDTQTSGETWSAGGAGKTTAEMQTAKTFLDAGWDFVGETANGTKDIWKIAEGLGYPRLAWEKYSGGTGEPNDPYQIATAADLIALGETPEDYDKHLILTADIDLDPNLPRCKVFDRAIIAPDASETNEWLEFDGTPFTGVFNGNEHTISHLTIAGKSNLGLFGWLESGAEVRDLAVLDVSIIGTRDNVGSLAAYCGPRRRYYEARVIHCRSSGMVRGNRIVGGLVGTNCGDMTQCDSCALVRGDHAVGGLTGSNEGDVIRCCGTGTVSGSQLSQFVGGLVGDNEGDVAECYSTATVHGNSGIGGLIGLNDEGADVTYCYSSGPVSSTRSVVSTVGGLVGTNDKKARVSRCFWDVVTSSQTTSAGGTGKTTAEMQTARTFLEAGWDFVGETVNGTEDIWWILEGKDYPRLWWETHNN